MKDLRSKKGTVGSLAAAHGFRAKTGAPLATGNTGTGGFGRSTFGMEYHHRSGHVITHTRDKVTLHTPGGTRIPIHDHKELEDRIKHLK
jgi:hypothetical protein